MKGVGLGLSLEGPVGVPGGGGGYSGPGNSCGGTALRGGCEGGEHLEVRLAGQRTGSHVWVLRRLNHMNLLILD